MYLPLLILVRSINITMYPCSELQSFKLSMRYSGKSRKIIILQCVWESMYSTCLHITQLPFSEMSEKFHVSQVIWAAAKTTSVRGGGRLRSTDCQTDTIAILKVMTLWSPFIDFFKKCYFPYYCFCSIQPCHQRKTWGNSGNYCDRVIYVKCIYV